MTDAQPGDLAIEIGDTSISVTMHGAGDWILPIGAASLVDTVLERSDRPTPAQLTNALGIVHDHFDDILIEAPIVATAPSATIGGDHAVMLARVEVGTPDLPDDYVLDRADAEDVFRTLVSETRAQRRHNPGLDRAHVDTIIGTCCCVLAIMRRLDMRSITLAQPTAAAH